MPASHYHDFYEIYLFLGDEMSYFIDNRTFCLKRYDMVFIDRSIYHRTYYKESSSMDRLLFLFDDAFLSGIGESGVIDRIRALFKNTGFSFGSDIGEKLYRTWMEKIVEIYPYRSSILDALKLRYLVYSFLIELVSIFEGFSGYLHDTNGSPKHIKVREAVDYINSNYTRKLTLDEICDKCYVSKYYLCRIFKQITGSSIVSFINSKRLNEAEKLIKNSYLTITEISGTVGYSNINNFISDFSLKYGMTPLRYRKKYNNMLTC